MATEEESASRARPQDGFEPLPSILKTAVKTAEPTIYY
jgi:hypothetical protein